MSTVPLAVPTVPRHPRQRSAQSSGPWQDPTFREGLERVHAARRERPCRPTVLTRTERHIRRKHDAARKALATTKPEMAAVKAAWRDPVENDPEFRIRRTATASEVSKAQWGDPAQRATTLGARTRKGAREGG